MNDTQAIKKENTVKIDSFTLIAISIVVYILQNVLHELIGHGGANLLVGGKLISLSTAYLESDTELVSELGKRFIASAGTLVNLVFGLLFWLMLKVRIQSSSWKLFLWLSMTVNLLTATGYPLFSGILGVADWINVIQGLEPFWMWRITLIISGLVLYLAAIWIALSELNFLVGDDENRRIRAFKFSLIPYLSGSIASTIGAFFNPISLLFVLTSAASSFGGTSALAWMTQLYSTKLFTKKTGPPLQIERNWIWIFFSFVLLVIHIFIVGPGIRF